jgi:hypothetical protein
VTSDEFGYASTELKTDTAGKYEITASGDDILGSVTFDEIVYGVTIDSIVPKYLAKGSGKTATVTFTVSPKEYTAESMSMTANGTEWDLGGGEGGTYTTDLTEGADLTEVKQYSVKIIVDEAESNIENVTVFEVKLEDMEDKEINVTPTMPEVKVKTVVNPSSAKSYVEDNYELERAIKIEWTGKKWSSKFEKTDSNKKTDDWVVNFDSDFYGGMVTVTLKNTELNLDKKQTFKIKGTNADDTSVINWIKTFSINTTLGDDAAVKVAYTESRYKQFTNGVPTEGGVGEIGIFQVLDSPPLSIPNGIWNWRINVSDGCSELEDKMGYAKRRNLDREEYNLGHSYSQVELRYATVQAYNGFKKGDPIMFYKEFPWWEFWKSRWYMEEKYKGLYAEKALGPYGYYETYVPPK